MERRETKLFWQTMVTVYLWARYPQESLVDDNTAFNALLVLREYVEDAIHVLTNGKGIVDSDEQE